ncbi:MAG: hypothetical protein JSW07_12990, partial [bacterium]
EHFTKQREIQAENFYYPHKNSMIIGIFTLIYKNIPKMSIKIFYIHKNCHSILAKLCLQPTSKKQLCMNYDYIGKKATVEYYGKNFP